MAAYNDDKQEGRNPLEPQNPWRTRRLGQENAVLFCVNLIQNQGVTISADPCDDSTPHLPGQNFILNLLTYQKINNILIHNNINHNNLY